jgi:predicted anti-sigma-YlaC factor YlaD
VNCYQAIDLIGDALEAKLPGEIGIDFDEHMRECNPCRNYYEQIRLTRMALREIPRSGTTSPNRDLLIEKFRKDNGR